MAAGLERDVERAALRTLAGFAEGVHLGMWPAEAFVEAATDDGTASVENDGSDHRIRLDVSATPRGQREGFIQQLTINGMHFDKLAGAVCSGSKLIAHRSQLFPRGRRIDRIVNDASLRHRIVALVLPALAHQYLLLAIQHYDQYLAWPFSDAHKAALTNANYLYWLVSCYSVIVGAGATALVGRSVGAKDSLTANRAAGQAIVLAIIFGTLGTIAALLGLPALMHGLDLQGDAPEIAVAYLTPLAAVLVLQMIETAGIACLVGAGDTRTGLGVLAAVAIVNAPLAYGLSRGVGPFPNLGFLGIAYGTAISHALGGLIVLGLLLRGRSGLKISPALLMPDPGILKRLLRVSLPAAGDSLSGGLCQLWFLSIVNSLGSAASAAHGIALRWEAIGYLAAAGFGTTASSLVSQNLGAKLPERAARAGWLCLAAAAVFLSLVGVVFATFAQTMGEQYTRPGESEIITLTAVALRTVAFAMPALACVMVLTPALRSAGDARVPMFFTWFGFLGVRIPLAYLLICHFEIGLIGAWLAMLADLWLRGVLFVLRFASGRWKAIRV